MGNLSGPTLTAPGGAAYAAGDRIATVAPGARGQLVTSERGSVASVDPEAGPSSPPRTTEGPKTSPGRTAEPTAWPTAAPSPCTAARA